MKSGRHRHAGSTRCADCPERPEHSFLDPAFYRGRGGGGGGRGCEGRAAMAPGYDIVADLDTLLTRSNRT